MLVSAESPLDCNVSVFASLTCPKVILHASSSAAEALSSPYLLWSSLPGVQCPTLSEDTTWETLRRVSPAELLAVHYQPAVRLPEGFAVFDDVALHVPRMFTLARLSMEELQALPMEGVLQYCKARGLLPDLRRWLHAQESLVVGALPCMLAESEASALLVELGHAQEAGDDAATHELAARLADAYARVEGERAARTEEARAAAREVSACVRTRV